MGTAILTPFTLWRLILPSFKPRNWASTLKDLDRSVHVRTLDGSGSAKLDGQPDSVELGNGDLLDLVLLREPLPP